MVRKAKHSPVFWIFLAPVVAAFLLVIIIPFFLGVFYSFTDWSSSAANQGGLKFVGFANYDKSLHDPKFLFSFGVTSVYTVLNMIAVNAVAFGLALLVSTQIKGRNVYRAGFFIPNLIGGLVLGFVWQFIFNAAIPFIGPQIGLGFLADPKNYLLANNVGALMALVIVGTWQSAGYIMMIYLAAIQSVPVELHEAAQIDGAGPARRLMRITLPLLKPTILFVTTISIFGGFAMFEESFIFWQGNSPNNVGLTMVGLLYKGGFQQGDLGMASTYGLVLMLIVFSLSLIQLKFFGFFKKEA